MAKKFSELEQRLLNLVTSEGCNATVEQIIVDIVQLIEEQELRRGEIDRAERSALSNDGALYQSILNRLMLGLIGIDHDKARYIDQRLLMML